MPNSPVLGEAALPRLSRRTVLIGSAASIAPVAACASPTRPDPELTVLRARFEQAIAAQQAAQRHFNDCERRYLDQCPDAPPELTCAGPLGEHLCHEGSHWTSCELRAQLRDPVWRTDWSAARALLPVALAFEARERRFCRRIGLRAAERAHEAANDALDELSALILSAPDSPAARALKGRVVKAWGRPEWWSSGAGHADCYQRFAAQLIDAVIEREALPSGAPHCTQCHSRSTPLSTSSPFIFWRA